MRFHRHLLLSGLVFAAAGAASLQAADFLDIPGEGDLRCLPADCPDSRGFVTSTPAGLVTGSLSGLLPTLDVSLTTSPLFLTFADGGTHFGPLGLNPEYDPQGPRDSRIPAAGQPIAIDITNALGVFLTDISFYLQVPLTVITAPFPSQPDGLSFGVWCNAPLEEPRNCPDNIALLMTPTGPGSLEPEDVTPAAGPGTTFGDLLRFRNVNLAPGDTARFTFFITDRKATLDPSSGGPFDGASASFNLEIVAAAVPEPSTPVAVGAGLLVLAVLAGRFRAS